MQVPNSNHMYSMALPRLIVTLVAMPVIFNTVRYPIRLSDILAIPNTYECPMPYAADLTCTCDSPDASQQATRESLRIINQGQTADT